MQVVLTIATLVLDGGAISSWNQNQYQFNYYFTQGAKASPDFGTSMTVGGTPFTGVVIAAVSPSRFHDSHNYQCRKCHL